MLKKSTLRTVKAALFSAIGLLSLGGAAVQAQGSIVVGKDQSLRVVLNGATGSVIVGNPRIADVTVIDSRTVFILGRGYGKSNITINDTLGRPLWNSVVTVAQTDASAVTLYKGAEPVTMICTQTCVAQETEEKGGSTITLPTQNVGSPVPTNP